MNLVPIDYRHMAFPVWKALWLDYVGPHASAMPPEVHQHTFDRVKSATPSLHGFVALTDRPVGFVHYYFHPSSYQLNDACTIEDLYVLPDARGLGIGRWLVETVAARAKAAGAPALHWRTNPANHQAIALYDKLATQTGVLSFRMQL